MSAPAQLQKVWRRPPGWRAFSEVNNVTIGRAFIATGFVFFLIGGLLALLLRIQLAVPDNDFLTPEAYNQIFTMHGTAMMFLVAVPIMEGFAVFLLPQMLGARDLPFPRLSAFGYWCYLLGGLLLFGSLLFGIAPRDGWFMYTPLSSSDFSPGPNTDIWLLGITFVEISALTAAVEIVTGVMKTRAPGMRLQNMPIFGWYMLVAALMILVAFPPLLVGDLLLEVERSLDLPFFDATRGGDPVLWQHLFWIFGHPEVYIIFLPAAGIVSTILPVMVRRRLVGYDWFILAAVSTAFISFGLWVHHMYAVGLPHLSLNFFAAASMAVAVPAAIQVFGWIATLWGTRPRLTTPMLFILGFLFIFVVGGMTGVMVASVPFDWQVHDTQFVVAHFHYVLIGGMVFPLFAALYYWMPLHSGRMLSERLGKWVFWLHFIGFNMTFGPMHVLGLLGMPRRIYLYPEQMGWGPLNFVMTGGALLLGLGALLFLIDVIGHHRWGRKAGGDPWGGATLEWSGPTPMPPWGSVSIPWADSRYPLWDDPTLARRMTNGELLLATPATGGRETLRTSSLHGRPEQVIALPGPSWLPLGAALAVLVAILGGLTYQVWLIALGLLALAVVVLRWGWDTDAPHAEAMVEIGDGIRLPTHGCGQHTHAWWGLANALLADLAGFVGLLFCYYYIWTVTPVWPPPLHAAGGVRWETWAALACVVTSSLVIQGAISAGRRGYLRVLRLGLPVGLLLGVGWMVLESAALLALWPDPTVHAYPALNWAVVAYGVIHMTIALLMGGLVTVRAWVGMVTPARPVMGNLLALFWHATVVFILLGAVTIHLFPLAV